MLHSLREKENIHLPGPIFGDRKYSLYRAADVFVTLSRNEGLSLAALESLAEGLPVLLTTDSNLPDVQEFDAGIVTVCEPVAVAEALMRLLEDNKRLFAMKANALRLHRERSPLARGITATYEPLPRSRMPSSRVRHVEG